MSTADADRDAIEARAADFLARRDGGWSAAAAADFAAWRRADPRHEAAARRLEATQHLLRRLPESPAAAGLLAELEQLEAARRPRLHRFPAWARAAAALAAAACLALAYVAFAPRSPTTHAYAAAPGENRSVGLTDGSTLLLASGSAVDVDYRRGERRVNLHQGQVHFAVAKDPGRPFVVAAGPVRVQAVGTAFNLRRTDTALEVTVTEGKVQVSHADRADPVYLIAGEGATIGPGAGPTPAAIRLAPADYRRRLAWQAPRLEFDNTPLTDVVARFNRYSPMQLEIGDPELAGRTVGGAFDGANAEAFANLMLASGDIRLERVSDTLIILRKAR